MQKVLEDYTITAPISGTVVEKNFKAGDTLDSTSASSAMAVIYDLSELEFELGVDELLIGKVQVGQDVIITADALPGPELRGLCGPHRHPGHLHQRRHLLSCDRQAEG